MCPNLPIVHVTVSSWFLMVGIGVVVTVLMAVYCVPKEFPLRRPEVAALSAFLAGAGLFGARILFNILHRGTITGGFAYFGALVMIILVLWIYSITRRTRFLELADYGAPFLFLSQAFVRIGCLMAGCCYGKPTNSPYYGLIFKPVDNVLRHPTQAYEFILLVMIYIIGRAVYGKEKGLPGRTLSLTLFLYGAGRFFIEFFRVDSPVIFLNLTLAQLTCLILVLIAIAFNRGLK